MRHRYQGPSNRRSQRYIQDSESLERTFSRTDDQSITSKAGEWLTLDNDRRIISKAGEQLTQQFTRDEGE